MKNDLFDYTKFDVKLALTHKSRADINKDLGISWETLHKTKTGESINLKILRDICIYLECDIGDIVSIKK